MPVAGAGVVSTAAMDAGAFVVDAVLTGLASDAGSEVEIRWRGDDELTVEIDGSLIERIAAAKDFSTTTPSFRFHLDGSEFAEIFAAPPEALDALAEFAMGSASPPWEHAAELLADGLIDAHVALTPRGKRAVARPS